MLRYSFPVILIQFFHSIFSKHKKSLKKINFQPKNSNDHQKNIQIILKDLIVIYPDDEDLNSITCTHLLRGNLYAIQIIIRIFYYEKVDLPLRIRRTCSNILQFDQNKIESDQIIQFRKLI